MPTELLPAEDELTAQELGTQIIKERTRVRKPPDWIQDFHPLRKDMNEILM